VKLTASAPISNTRQGSYWVEGGSGEIFLQQLTAAAAAPVRSDRELRLLHRAFLYIPADCVGRRWLFPTPCSEMACWEAAIGSSQRVELPRHCYGHERNFTDAPLFRRILPLLFLAFGCSEGFWYDS